MKHDTHSWVHEVLEPDQISTSRTRFPRRKLSRGTLTLLWLLRLYVVLMAVIVVILIRQALMAPPA